MYRQASGGKLRRVSLDAIVPPEEGQEKANLEDPANSLKNKALTKVKCVIMFRKGGLKY